MEMVPEQQQQNDGFTIIELMIVLVIIAVASSLAAPNMIIWYDNLSVKAAARDLYSTMQEARMTAVKENTATAIVFDTTNNCYYFCTDRGFDGNWGSATDMTGTGDNAIKRTVWLLSPAYKRRVQFGNGNATKPVPVGSTFGDFITYSTPNNVFVINSRGIGNAGYVYLANPNNGTAYAVGTLSSGIVKIFKWSGGTKWY